MIDKFRNKNYFVGITVTLKYFGIRQRPGIIDARLQPCIRTISIRVFVLQRAAAQQTKYIIAVGAWKLTTLG